MCRVVCVAESTICKVVCSYVSFPASAYAKRAIATYACVDCRLSICGFCPRRPARESRWQNSTNLMCGASTKMCYEVFRRMVIFSPTTSMLRRTSLTAMSNLITRTLSPHSTIDAISSHISWLHTFVHQRNNHEVLRCCSSRRLLWCQCGRVRHHPAQGLRCSGASY